MDTSVLIGALSRRDARHGPCLAVLEAADRGVIAPLVITDFILAETLNYLVRKAGTGVAREALRRIEASPGLQEERVSDAEYEAGRRRVFAESEGLSFVDALTVAFMRERGLARLYSLDHGFDRVAGLERLETLPR